MELPISGREVCVVSVARFGGYLRLDFWSGHPTSSRGHDYTLSIEGPFRIASVDGEQSFDQESAPHPAFLSLLGKTIRHATAFDSGELRIEFVDDVRLVIPPYAYEPWQLSGDDGSLIVSVAGGALTEWGPHPEK